MRTLLSGTLAAFLIASAGCSLTLDPEGVAPPVAPSGLSYSTNPAVHTAGVAIVANTPTSSGGAVASYSVSPTLPAGLTLNTTSGVVSGTPTAVTPQATYTVTAANPVGSTSVDLVLTVNDAIPSSLVYATNPAVYTKGVAIPSNTQTHSGGFVASYSVSPALPAGLTLNTTTGVVSGTPTVVVAQATYTVTVTNALGSTTVALVITVNDVPPSALAYSTNPAVYTKGFAITGNAPASSGGAVVTYSVAPPLPAGLTLDTSTGVISGIPTAITSQTSYTVTGTNSGGSTSVAVVITVNDAAPSNLGYSSNPAVYATGIAIPSNTPSHSGGVVVSYSIWPTLPAGLTLSTTSGVISGTPIDVTTQATYTVTATNSGGFTTAALVLTVNALPPANLAYSTNPAVYAIGETIAANSATSSGGAVVTYSVSPNLPAGLTLDPFSGVITGTTAEVKATASYVVTAANPFGSTSVTLVITVSDSAPRNLTYATSPAVYTKGQPISPNTPSSSGGPVVTYSVSPALPTGLQLDPVSGAITGTPTALAAQATYTVTATNSGGSSSVWVGITVNDAAPINLTYSTNPAVYTMGVAIPSNVPASFGGAVVSYSVVPALPTGLTLDPASGAITGSPTAIVAVRTHTVTATNSGGSTAVVLTITVNDRAPANLRYSYDPAVYEIGVAIPENYPTYSGGVAVSYSVSPALPPGLGLDPTSGVISGSATAFGPPRAYTVTATNSGGSTPVVLTITVNDRPPATLTYSRNPAVYTAGVAIQDNYPSSGGGAVASYEISPALPPGLVFDGATGVISGMPAVGSPTITYTVTAANSGGWTQATLMITVKVDVVVGTIGALAAGQFHACAIVNGGVECWGSNSDGQLGNSDSWGSYSPVPVPVDGLASGVQAITAGAYHTCALVNGGVFCWGSNSEGQLGYGSYGYGGGASPVPVNGLSSGVQAISAGDFHTCAIQAGSAWCWGNGFSGQLGAGDFGGSQIPVQVMGLYGEVQAISAGGYHSCALVNGGAHCWGNSQFGQLGDGSSGTNSPVPVPVWGLETGVQAIAGGQNHTCALVNGGARCWGWNEDGQLGDGNFGPGSPTAVQVQGLWSGVQAITGGTYHTCALSNGSALCWGRNSRGQLGDGSFASSAVPVQVSGLWDGAVAIAPGYEHTCALANGAVLCWGINERGQLGNGDGADRAEPVPVAGLSNHLAKVDGGFMHTCALVNGGVQCWGSNSHGQLGDGGVSGAYSPVPVPVSNLSRGAQAVSAGMYHTCAVVNGGAVCWGDNLYGQLGNGSPGSSSSVPVPVQGLWSGVQAISAGTYHTCAIVDGRAFCWGHGGFGQLGDGSATNTSVPVPVFKLDFGVQVISAGMSHTCAVQNGTASCWGNGDMGQLGDGSYGGSYVSAVPVQVLGFGSGVQSISAGANHTCGLVNGAARCWGDAELGQLGNGSSGPGALSAYPVDVIGLWDSVQTLEAGTSHTCALVNGAARCWGSSEFGQLGDGTVGPGNFSPSPVEVYGLWNGVEAIAAGYDHNCAIANGRVLCWGRNDQGQLGNGATAGSVTPAPVTGLLGGAGAGFQATCSRPNDGTCFTYIAGFDAGMLDDESWSCMNGGGTWSTLATCRTRDQIGKCSHSSGFVYSEAYYAPLMTPYLPDVRAGCVQYDGAWTAQ